jgi:hypothetical protein
MVRPARIGVRTSRDAAFCRRGSELHVHADLGPGGSRPDLHQVTKLVHNPHPRAADLGVRVTTAGERVADVTGVLSLAEQLICGGPDGKPPPAPV